MFKDFKICSKVQHQNVKAVFNIIKLYELLVHSRLVDIIMNWIENLIEFKWYRVFAQLPGEASL